jgi:hypothetical protein
LKKCFFSRAGPHKPGQVTGLNQWLDWLLNGSVREQFTHACYSHNVIKLHLHSVCAMINGRRKNEKLTWLTTIAGGNPSWACRWDSEKKLWCHSLSCSIWFLVLEKGKLMVMPSSSTGFLFPPLSLYFLVRHLFWVFFPVVQCWCGCVGEWQWLLDEEDDELTMALAVLVRHSPLFFSFLCHSPLVFPLVSPPFHRLSLAFISQRMACSAMSNLVTACRGIVAVKHSP